MTSESFTSSNGQPAPKEASVIIATNVSNAASNTSAAPDSLMGESTELQLDWLATLWIAQDPLVCTKSMHVLYAYFS